MLIFIKQGGRKVSIGVDWVRRHVGAELTSLTTGSSL